MQRQRSELVPIGDALADLSGPVAAIRDASPQALHHFTQADQVNLLVNASEAEPDLGFMARMLVLCSLPRANPGTQKEYKRVNGPYTLAMTAGVNTKLPFGNLPRLLLAWICTEAVRTQSRELVLGRSLSDFMGKLGMAPVGGGSHWCSHAAPQSDATALSMSCPVDPRARARHTVRFLGHRRPG